MLYTDALIEAIGPAGAQLGEQGLRDMLAGRAIDDPAQFLRVLLADLSDWAGGTLGDDATAILVRRVATRAKPLTGLGAPIRIGAAAFRSWLGEGGPIPWPQPRLDNILGPFLPFLNRRQR